MRASGAYSTTVVEDPGSGRVVGTATLFVERKFIRGLGLAGHIEDVVVDAACRGMGVGKLLLDTLTQVPRGARAPLPAGRPPPRPPAQRPRGP